jgi:hypothetical protein
LQQVRASFFFFELLEFRVALHLISGTLRSTGQLVVQRKAPRGLLPSGADPSPQPPGTLHMQGRAQTKAHAMGGGPLSRPSGTLYQRQQPLSARLLDMNGYGRLTARGYAKHYQLQRPVRVDSWGNVIGRSPGQGGLATM